MTDKRTDTSIFDPKHQKEEIRNVSNWIRNVMRPKCLGPKCIVCACPYSSNIGLSALTLYYHVQDRYQYAGGKIQFLQVKLAFYTDNITVANYKYN